MKLLQNEDLVGSVRIIQKAASDLKLVLFRCLMKGETAWKPRRDDYISKAYSFINTWKEYGNDLQEDMKHAEGNEGVYSIKQNSVREYIYAKYDLASILPFVDGVFKGIKKNEFDNPEDFYDFWKYTAQKAFKGRADSIGGLVEEVISLRSDTDSYSKATSADAKMFDAVRHQQIFSPGDARELFKSIEKAVEFLFYSHDDGEYNYPEGTMMRIAVVNSIIDYATYSMTAFATRIFAVYVYAAPFIQNSKDYSEAVHEFAPKASLHATMKNTDEGVARDFRRLGEYVESLQSFLTDLGMNDEVSESRDKYSYPGSAWRIENPSDGNMFSAALLSNPLREMVFSFLSQNRLLEVRTGDRMKAIADQLRDYIHNGRMPYSDTSTAKDEILVTIARLEPDKKTVEGYQKLGSDLVKFCGGFLSYLYAIMKDHYDHEEFGTTRVRNTNPSMLRDEREIIELLYDLYKDIAVALLYRARDIEERLNLLLLSDIEKSEHLLNVKFPGQKVKSLRLSHSMTPIVPVTQRIPLEVMNLYSDPIKDRLDLYDEAAKMVLPNDPFYFTEAGDESVLSKIWNAIAAFFTSIGERAGKFANDITVKKSVEWVKKHQSELESMTHVPPMMAKPYVSEIRIDLAGGLDVLKNHFNKDLLTDEGKFKSFQTALYDKDEQVRSLFQNKDIKAEDATEIFKNHILFNLPLVASSANQVAEVELRTANEIAEKMAGWIKTVIDGQDALNRFANTMSEYSRTLKDCQRKTAEWTKELEDEKKEAEKKPETQSTQTQSGDQDEAPAMTPPSDKKEGGSGNQNVNASFDFSDRLSGSRFYSEAAKENPSKKLNELMNSMYESYTKTKVPTYNAIVQAIKDQYKYIQTAYYNAKGKKEQKQPKEK